MSIFKLKVTSDFIVNSLCTITVGVGVVEYTVKTFFNDSYVKYFKEAYKNGQPIPLSESLRKQYNDVIHDMKHTDFQKAFSIPFTAEGLKPVNVGCLNTRSGCYIGIPSIYDFNSVEDISSLNSENVDLKGLLQIINNNSEFGQTFMQSLILSDPAKKFSIARELVLTDNFRVIIKSISFSITLMPMYVLGHVVLSSLPANPAKIRILAFFLLCNIGVFVSLLIRTAIENYYQSSADKGVCDIGGIEYIHGGIEYYEKLIQRNLVLRNIIPEGKKIYSEQGDEIGFISVFSELPLSYRKKRLEHILKNYKNEKNEIKNEDETS